MHSSPLGLSGNILQLVAVIVSVLLGFKEQPAVLSIFICGLTLEIAWVFVRFPQIIAIWRSDGIKIGKLLLIQLVLSSTMAGVFYGIGFGVSQIFS